MEDGMEIMARESRSRGGLVWLRSPRRNPVRHRPRGEAAVAAPFFRNLLHGISLLPGVSMLMMLLAGMDGGGSPNLFEVVAAGLFISLYTVVPAVTGGLLYLPLVSWAARRWPRRARAIAVAASPLIALGTVPWGMAGFLGLWSVVIPVAAGLIYYGATIRLPVDSPATDAEGAR
jgi:hypothetical protein